MVAWTVYLSLCLLVALRASGAFLEIHKTDGTVGREASEASPSPNCRPKTQCEQQRDAAERVHLIGNFIPQCDEEGQYRPQQCCPSTGYCWCVDSKGQEILGTRTPPGTPPINCVKPGAFLEKHMTDVEEGREASEASPNPHYEDDTSNSEADSGLRPRDSVKTTPSAACMDGWSAFGCRCFKFFYNPQTWSDAEKFCLQFDGNLASVHSHEEYAFIQNLIRSETQASTPAWIGGHDAVHEGVWLWSDGTKMNFQIWAPGEPNNYAGKEHCIEMNYGRDGNWNDDKCYRNTPFVCVN